MQLSRRPRRRHLLQKLHELEESHRVLNIAVRIDRPFRESNARTIQPRNNRAIAALVELASLVVKFHSQARTVLRQLRQRVTGETDRLDDVRAVGEMLTVLFRLAGLATRAVDLGDYLSRRGSGQLLVFQLGAGKVGGQALQAGVIAQDPAVHVLRVAQGVAGEPFDAEVRVGVLGEGVEVEEGEDSTVGGADDGDGARGVGWEGLRELGGLED